MSQHPHLLPLPDCRDTNLVGGKAANLARLISAGFPVPEGFVVTTAAFRTARTTAGMTSGLAKEILDAYCALGSVAVVVRSSATAEDLAGASMAGQYETILDVRGAPAIIQAVEQCWASLLSDRARAYLAERNLDPEQVAMAVIVQRLLPAEAAGVLFTANPHKGSIVGWGEDTGWVQQRDLRGEMLLEASWGLGESVVSGKVQPDTLVLDRTTGMVRSASIATKNVQVTPGRRELSPVPEEKRNTACLSSRQVHQLWRLGLRVAEHFGSPQDIEWAIDDGEVYLLQSRPITTLEDAEAQERCLQEAGEQLRRWKQQGRGDWVLHNLAETLPHPTPLTWSVIRRFMSGDGGFGAMYRGVGFQPSATVRQEGCLELIGGRIYLDLSRGPDMFFPDFPYRYDLELLRADPDAAQGPPTLPAGSLVKLYWTGRRVAAIQRRLDRLSRDYDERLESEIVPALVQYVREEKARDLTAISTAQWLESWRQRERRVLDEFGGQALLPSLIAAMAMERLRTFLDEHFWDDQPRELANLLAAGAEPDQTLAASQNLFELARGQSTVEDWLARHGHRAPEEFDLASPRWHEQREALLRMASRLKDVGFSPAEMRAKRAGEAAAKLAELEGRLSRGLRRELRRHVALARRYIRFREDGKHYLMLGYELLRDMVLEAGRRLQLDGDVFLLSLDELRHALTTGYAPLGLIEQRRAERAVESKVRLPNLITVGQVSNLPSCDDGESKTRPGDQGKSNTGPTISAFPISAGRGAGPARIVLSPQDARELAKGYVLVCPSTDPSWTPLFINAAAVVLECGGTLSHGAIVAREMGIPGVVCPGATRAFSDGEALTVDAHQGTIARAQTPGSSPNQDLAFQSRTLDPGPDDIRLRRHLVPPVPGRRERRSARVRDVFLVAWAAYFAAALLLPGEWLYNVAMGAMDRLLWPVVATWGKPAAVATIAVGLAVATMLAQRLLTDNRRLRVARQRAAALRRLAAKLPADSPRRKALIRLAAPVQNRLVMAAFVPLAVLLGPMIVPVVWWFPARVAPASWNPRPGATAHVVATVDGDYTQPITLEYDQQLLLDESVEENKAVKSLPPIKEVLETRLAEWRRQTAAPRNQPWELQWLNRIIEEDLAEYLHNGVPPQAVSWSLTTPEEPGRYWVMVSAGDSQPVDVLLVVGDDFPPEPKEIQADGKSVQVVRPADAGSPIQSVRVAWTKQKERGDDVFWAPFAPLGWSRDMGWLLLYIILYVPAMLVLRWVLRIA